MNLLEQAKLQPWFKRLDKRTLGFSQILDHLNKTTLSVIIETGTAWTDFWEGHGCSTQIWDWVIGVAPKFEAYSIDIEIKSIQSASAKTKEVNYILGDSIRVLNDFSRSIISETALLYLDSFDWLPEMNLESPFHHMAELATVWSQLPPGCLIVVDDRHSDAEGKHWFIEAFMKAVGTSPLFVGYQIGFIKK